MKKVRYLKARLTTGEYEALKALADAAGLTVSEYVRSVLAKEREAEEIEATLARIEAQLAAPVVLPATETAGGVLEPLLVESVLLMRELAAERNAQVLARVAQRLNALYPERSRV
jgi:hypothetical protein